MINPSNKTSKKIKSISKRKLSVWVFVLLLGWLLLWFCPWQSWIQAGIWIKVGISIIAFVVPGALLFWMLSTSQPNWCSTISFGFAISHLLIAALGTFGRFIHLPFRLATHLYMFSGLVLLILFSLRSKNPGKLSATKPSSFEEMRKAWPLIIISILTVLMTVQRTITADDLTYLTLLTKFQHSTSLDFTAVFLGTANTIPPRFWLVSTPFSQAFLAEFSGLHGIYWIGGFYEPFLALLSITSLYQLSKSLGLSRKAATAAVAFQIVFLALLSNYLSPGSPFFSQLSVDKATATFIVVPVFVISVIELLDHTTLKNFILCLIVGLSLSLMHAVTLAFSLVVVGFIVLLRITPATTVKSVLPLFIIILIILTPQLFMRFANPDTQGSIAYAIKNSQATQGARGSENLISVLDNTIFYGFNPSILAMTVPYQAFIPFPDSIIKWGWTIIPLLATMFAYTHLKNNRMAQFLIASFLLVALAGIPFSGWILGHLVSPRMIARTVWLYPYGIAMTFLLISIRDRTGIGKKVNIWGQRFLSKYNITSLDLPLSLITIFSTALILLVMRFQHLPNITRLHTNVQRYQELATIGYFLDEQINDQAIAIGSNDLNDLLPGISGKVNGITFRPSNPMYAYYYSQKEREDRLLHQQQILSNKISPEERLELIRNYNIKYLLIKSGEYWLVKNLISTYPDKFERTQLGRYLLFEINE